MLRRLPPVRDKNLIVGANTADDAGIYRLSQTKALVQTVDFFTPIVDDPYTYGQIAAANALSDVYAMGGRPLTAMNVLGIPTDVVGPKVIARILQGGAATVKQAKCALVGGHTLRNPEPIYGLAVTGLVNPKGVMTNANARPGDLLVLTKPLGTGITTTGIKRGLTSLAMARKAISVMRRLNDVGAQLAEMGLVRAATDLTGFGLLGHLASMCRASEVGAVIESAKAPALGAEIFTLIAQDCVPGGSRDNRKTADTFVDWNATPEAQRTLLTDAQTSGGLLLCVAPKRLDAVQALLRKYRTPAAAIVGAVTRM
ncbi:MAG TPA: selenide, water dikinase SelD, partial [Tepidisphaeraceae bacterium]|nr:selenide, water dikinase SelD [Tepidisphaeraceae bacterium]